MRLPKASSNKVLNIYLTLNEYPILSSRIRARMRQQIFSRGVINTEDFEVQVRQKSIQSQFREGLSDLYGQEATEVWEQRLERVRDYLTDFYFANHLPNEEFEKVVHQVVSEPSHERPDLVTFNPELAPLDMLFEQAEAIKQMPDDEQADYKARLQEIKVVLIRAMISDQLAYINVARQWFTISDLKEIRYHKIGEGKIGGKAAGMLLAARILSRDTLPEVRATIVTPPSYFIGSDVIYTFMSANGLMHWADQKYKPEEQICAEYAQIQKDFTSGELPREVVLALRNLLVEIGKQPIIVRSSSLLEDNFGTSFAGKYDSFFLPNQGTLEENLITLKRAIMLIYASSLNPNALLYRRQKGLIDYDERMALLIQIVQGEQFGNYFLPHAAGVAFSRNLYRWSTKIRKEDGFIRMVWGLGTRAIEQVGNDYPRLVALSHPFLHPASSPKEIQRHSQRYVDLLDLKMNALRTLPIREVLTLNYPALRYIVQIEEDGYLSSPRSRIINKERLIITFEGLLCNTAFAEYMRLIVKRLEEHYHSPVDIEFTVQVTDLDASQPGIRLALLQCRPLNQIEDKQVSIPDNLPKEDIIFTTFRMVPRGVVDGIRYVLLVTHEGYFQLTTDAERHALERAISSLNATLKEDKYICVGPGRWGTSTPDLGIRISYSDIYNTSALVEMTGRGIGLDLEPSFGTHFFQDLMEARIYPLAINLDDKNIIFNHDFFYKTPNHLSERLTVDGTILNCLRLIQVDDYRPDHSMTLIMDDDLGKSVAFLSNIENESSKRMDNV